MYDIRKFAKLHLLPHSDEGAPPLATWSLLFQVAEEMGAVPCFPDGNRLMTFDARPDPKVGLGLFHGRECPAWCILLHTEQCEAAGSRSAALPSCC